MHERGPKGALNEPFGAPKVHERCTFLTTHLSPPHYRTPEGWEEEEDLEEGCLQEVGRSAMGGDKWRG